MAQMKRMRGSVLLKYDPEILSKVADKVSDILMQAARGMSEDTRQRAPYDPASRRANGKQKQGFPSTHHRDSIRWGQVNPNKWRPRKTDTSTLWGNNKTRMKSYYILSFSGRGYWLEKGTKGFRGPMKMTYTIEDYASLAMAERNRSKQMLIKRQYREYQKDKRVHFATKAQPHFMPAFRKWKRWVNVQIRNII